MKRTIRTPYFEIGTKNYIWGDKVLELSLIHISEPTRP